MLKNNALLKMILLILFTVGLFNCSKQVTNGVTGTEKLGGRYDASLENGVSGGYAGVTPGGSQDIGYVRSIIAAGNIPDTSSFTFEGLFSEHDFYIELPVCEQVICANFAQAAYYPIGSEQSHRLVQLLLTSNVEIASFHHRPTQFFVVFDRSGSMTGEKFSTTCNALSQLVNFLDDGDQFGLISFNHEYTLDWELSPLTANRDSIITVINGLSAGGSTDIESALRAAFVQLSETDNSDGLDQRVLLFTDALPNTGNIAENDFLTLAQTYADQGIGITAFGVGLDFGIDLATSISEIRGGNYVYLRDTDAIEELINEDFEFLITPVAYDFRLQVQSGNDYYLSAVYGLPGDADGEFSLQAATLFLSRSKGAIGLEFVSTGSDVTGRIAELSLSYVEAESGSPINETVVVEAAGLIMGNSEIAYDQIGAQKLVALIEMVRGMKYAVGLYINGDVSTAVEHLGLVADRLNAVAVDLEDDTVLTERDLVVALAENME
ncbi:MAG: VWA domain-containing protein [Candidatus Marinimicrobia bacterium]|nr:VWA domain-containing protein [Candidatus Neomarinimicrobiota bacterium]